MKNYVIVSNEEVVGKEYYVLKVPKSTPFEIVKEKVEMAKKYAYYPEEFYNENDELDVKKGIEVYDEHYEAMIMLYNECNGKYVFDSYLCDICGWTIENLNVDFEYEW
jgi:hypothetical protein